MERWQGKVALVTGASSGIGAAICEGLARVGVLVVGIARRVEKVEALSKTVNPKCKSGKIFAYKADMTKESDIINAINWTEKTVGPLHILVNNAGMVPATNLLQGDTEKWKMCFDTNVLGVCIATREAVKRMMEKKIDGHIFIVNSVLGHSHVYFPGMNVYPATKHAITNLAEQLRQELRLANTKIKISCVSPGYVLTGIVADQPLNDAIKDAPSLASEDIWNAVLYMLGTPPHVQVHDLIIKPLGEQC